MNNNVNNLVISTSLGLLPAYSQPFHEVIHSQQAAALADLRPFQRQQVKDLCARIHEAAKLGWTVAAGGGQPNAPKGATGTKRERWFSKMGFLVGWHGFKNSQGVPESGDCLKALTAGLKYCEDRRGGDL